MAWSSDVCSSDLPGARHDHPCRAVTGDKGSDGLLRGAVDYEAQGRLIHALRRQQCRSGQCLYARGLSRLPGLWHRPLAIGAVDVAGVVLKPVSSTTSHAGAVEFGGQWYLAYHTADARDGGHFRRSVALDRLEWDDSVSPAAIRPVTARSEEPTAELQSI